MSRIPYSDIEYTCSAELCEKMSQECDTAILAFSTGKDSIASWLQMRRYFKHIIPIYRYAVPGLQFVEDSLKYYEDFFGCHIYRLPHPSLFRKLTYGVFQPPDRASTIMEQYAIDLNTYTYAAINDIVRNTMGLSDSVYAGVGIRMADSPMRRVAIRRYGAIIHREKNFYPVYDWRKEDMMQAFTEARIRLPVDYRIWGRTFDGLNYSFIKPLKEWFPDDYKRCLDWFPLMELEIGRWEGVNTIQRYRSDTHEPLEGTARSRKGRGTEKARTSARTPTPGKP